MSAASPAAARARAPNYVEAASRRSCAASSRGFGPRRGGPAFLVSLVLWCVNVLACWTRCVGRVAASVMLGQPPLVAVRLISHLRTAAKQSPSLHVPGPVLASNLLQVDPLAARRNAAECREAWGFFRKYPHVRQIRAAKRPPRARIAQTALYSAYTCARLSFLQDLSGCSWLQATARLLHTAQPRQQPCQSRARASPASSRSP